MLFPKKVKHRKWQTGRRNSERVIRATRGATLHFGSYGLKATSGARITSNQIEAARKAISRNMGKLGKYWIRVFPDRPITKKGDEVGMGKGKGDPYGFCFEAEPGRIIFEVDNVAPEIAAEALRKAGAKLPMKSKIVNRDLVG